MITQKRSVLNFFDNFLKQYETSLGMKNPQKNQKRAKKVNVRVTHDPQVQRDSHQV
jgi:hypothetical protein